MKILRSIAMLGEPDNYLISLDDLLYDSNGTTNPQYAIEEDFSEIITITIWSADGDSKVYKCTEVIKDVYLATNI